MSARVFECVCVCVLACVRSFVRACVCVCAHWGDTRAYNGPTGYFYLLR